MAVVITYIVSEYLNYAQSGHDDENLGSQKNNSNQQVHLSGKMAIKIEEQIKSQQREYGGVIKLVKNLKITVEASEKNWRGSGNP